MAAECPFCQIVAGARPAAVVFEDPVSMAFLDSRPLFPGHCLLIPKDHIETLADLSAGAIGPLFANARRLALALENGLGAEGAFVAVNHRVSQSVPHLHIHVVPRKRKDGLRGFFWPRGKYATAEEQEAVRTRLAAAFAAVASSV